MPAIAIAILLFAVNFLFPQSYKPDAAVGTWLTEENEAKVKIYLKDGKYYGKIVWLQEPLNEKGKPKKDLENPDEDKRSREILGLVILKHFVYDGDGEYTDGEVYDPKRGRTVDAELTLHGNDKLEVRGYLGLSFIGKSVYWSRAGEE